MSSWLTEDMDEAKKDGGALPNPSAPRLVKEGIVKSKRPKKPVMLKVDADVHKQLSRLTNLRKIAGDDTAAVTNIFMEGLELYLKKHKLPSTNDIQNGTTIEDKHL